MTCADIQRKLSAFTDGELPRWTRWKVQLHVGCCPDCHAVLREFEDMDRAFAQAVHACPAPEYLTDAVMRRLPAMPPAWRRQQNLTRWGAGVALAGVQLLAVYGAYWFGFARGTTSPGVDPVRGELTSPLGGASLRPHSFLPAPRAHSSVSSPSAIPLWSREQNFPVSFSETLEVPASSRRNPPLDHPVLQPAFPSGGAIR